MNILIFISEKKYFLIVLSLLLLLAIPLLQFLGSDRPQSQAMQQEMLGDQAVPVMVEKNEIQFNTQENILELSMFKLATVDGSIRADKDGELIIDRDLRHWIDFYLSAIGSLSLAEIRQIMIAEITLLPMPARDQALELLTDYLNYKEELANYDNQNKEIVDYLDSLQHRHDWQKRLRRQILAKEAVEAFWHLDEIVDDYALAQLVISASDNSEEDKVMQLEHLDLALPIELKSFRDNLYIASNLQESVNAYRQQGGSEENVRQMRIEQVGIEATERLEQLDKKNELWLHRIRAYANEVKSAAQTEGLSEQDKEQQLKRYRENNFEINEQLRLDSALHLLMSG